MNKLKKISVRNVSKRFDINNSDQGVVLQNVVFEVATNEFLGIVGRSGCGKSTMLNIIAGLLFPSEGEVSVNEHIVDKPGFECGMVFQYPFLFPWLTAIQNVQFGPRNVGMGKEKRTVLAQELINLVGLTGSERKYPRELSGGMQQRVAIARALALNPDILLMDEPFGALDQLTREDMQHELLRIWESRRKTVVFVTHSITEAIYLCDRILVFNQKPGFVKKEFTIEIPRPRQKSAAEFMKYYEEIYEAIG